MLKVSERCDALSATRSDRHILRFLIAPRRAGKLSAPHNWLASKSAVVMISPNHTVPQRSVLLPQESISPEPIATDHASSPILYHRCELPQEAYRIAVYVLYRTSRALKAHCRGSVSRAEKCLQMRIRVSKRSEQHSKRKDTPKADPLSCHCRSSSLLPFDDMSSSVAPSLKEGPAGTQ